VTAGPVLIIGAAGLVGSNVRAAFAGHRVVATRYRRNVSDAELLDITDASATRALIRRLRPAAVVLAAADPSVERCEREPVATHRVNVDAAQHAAEATAEVGALLVVFSSEYVFDGQGGPYDEDAATAPVNEYGRQKVALERIARELPRHLVCRTSGVFGWDDERKNFACQVIDHLRSGRRFSVPSDQVITATYAPSLGTAVRDLVDGGHVGLFHVAGPRVLPRVEIARGVARAFGLDESLIDARPTAELGLAAPRPRSAGLSTQRLRAAIGHGLLDPADALAEMRKIETEARG
jgi:dTDP-4-dehydrorhamnose reductase